MSITENEQQQPKNSDAIVADQQMTPREPSKDSKDHPEQSHPSLKEKEKAKQHVTVKKTGSAKGEKQEITSNATVDQTKEENGAGRQTKTGEENNQEEQPGSSNRRRKNYSTAYFVYTTSIYTNEVIKYFQKKTFGIINNCLFNICMVHPIHLDEDEFEKLYSKLLEEFEKAENELLQALEKLDELLNSQIAKQKIFYTAPLQTQLQIKTPLALRYVKILENLDLLLRKIDQALTAGYIQNPRDAVKLKFQWTRNIFNFTGAIRDIDKLKILQDK